MKPLRLFLSIWSFAFLATLVTNSSAPGVSDKTPVQDGDKLVFADFEAVQDNRPVSSRGGFIQMVS
jgi:hypothetical protein